MNTVEAYAANDGTLFNTYEDCKRYETRLSNMNILSNIEMRITYYNISSDEGWPDNIIKILWYKPKNILELNAINEYYGINISNTVLNRWVCIHILNINSYIDDSIIERCPYDLYSKFTLFDATIDPINI